MSRFNIASVVSMSAMSLILAAGCGGDDTTSGNNDMIATGGDMAKACTKVKVSGQAISPETAMSEVSIALHAGMMPMPNPLTAGVTVVPETDKMQTVTASDAMGAWSFNGCANTLTTPYIVENTSFFASLSDPLPVGTTEIVNIPAHVIYKDGDKAVTKSLAAAGGPAQAALLAQGFCFVDTLKSHNPDPIPEAVTIAVDEAGYDIYSIDFDAAGKAVATKSNDGGMTGRFVITKNGNTAKGTIHITATDKATTGGFTYAKKACRIEPGIAVFFPYEHS